MACIARTSGQGQVEKRWIKMKLGDGTDHLPVHNFGSVVTTFDISRFFNTANSLTILNPLPLLDAPLPPTIS